MKKLVTLILVLVAFTLQAQSLDNSDALAVNGFSVASNIELRVEAFPNPTTDYVTIESDQLISGYEIYSVSGQRAARKRIYKRRKRKRSETIDFSVLAEGVYFLHVELESGFVVKQLLKI